jgi:DNA-binding NtrC family response regulator
VTFVAGTRAMQAVARQIRRAAATEVPVMLNGETGTGRDTVAATIHRESARSGSPYAALNLRLPADPASALFGRADGEVPGVFEASAGGTVYLDGADVVGGRIQLGLLRVIEEKRTIRTDGEGEIPVDIRLIVSANQDLAALAARGAFLSDLLFRLEALQIHLPPLRERVEDIAPLATAFYRDETGATAEVRDALDEQCLAALLAHDWPGNVRELGNVIRSAAAASGGEQLRLLHLPDRLKERAPRAGVVLFEVGTPLDEVERVMIERTLAQTGGNRKRTAELLGISRRSLYNKLGKMGLG